MSLILDLDLDFVPGFDVCPSRMSQNNFLAFKVGREPDVYSTKAVGYSLKR